MAQRWSFVSLADLPPPPPFTGCPKRYKGEPPRIATIFFDQPTSSYIDTTASVADLRGDDNGAADDYDAIMSGASAADGVDDRPLPPPPASVDHRESIMLSHKEMEALMSEQTRAERATAQPRAQVRAPPAPPLQSRTSNGGGHDSVVEDERPLPRE